MKPPFLVSGDNVGGAFCVAAQVEDVANIHLVGLMAELQTKSHPCYLYLVTLW
jgi:hypothetical protein